MAKQLIYDVERDAHRNIDALLAYYKKVAKENAEKKAKEDKEREEEE